MTDQRTYPYGYKSIHGGTARGMGHPHQQEVSISNRRARVQAKKSYKILLIGESSVGKTTMAVRLCEDRFMLNPTSKPTLGQQSSALFREALYSSNSWEARGVSTVAIV